ncbi:glutathione S-transferase family protein [Allosphingosinicella sp.]|uniref:glutathione S-transferase family protein n=1 Tax=Allosphingosinicella sp. TaxID=2823234 RepID=UPI0039C8669B
MMRLHYHPFSPASIAVLVTADLLGVPLEPKLVDLFQGEGNSDAFRALNPNGLVPVLEDGISSYGKQARFSNIWLQRPRRVRSCRGTSDHGRRLRAGNPGIWPIGPPHYRNSSLKISSRKCATWGMWTRPSSKMRR